ncbi:hypothetical protein ACWEQU_28715, partial [Streptomyces nodosus]
LWAKGPDALDLSQPPRKLVDDVLPDEIPIPQCIVAHAATRDEAELLGRDLTEHGYAVECALLQSVELDTRAWTEKERSVAFLLSGRLPERSP